jgi:hypothetical protein
MRITYFSMHRPRRTLKPGVKPYSIFWLIEDMSLQKEGTALPKKPLNTEALLSARELKNWEKTG